MTDSDRVLGALERWSLAPIADHAGLFSGGVPTAASESYLPEQLGTVPEPPTDGPQTDPSDQLEQ